MNVLESFSVAGKTALVTGCSRGIGFAMAEGLAEAGSNIIGVSASLPAQGSAIADAVQGLGREFCGYRCDFGDRDQVKVLVSKLTSAHDLPDILVNNAGTIRRQPAAEHSDAFWDEVIDVNLTSPFILAREIGGQMVERGSGKVIFTASLLSFQGGINVPSYAASKGGIAQLTKALSNEWAGSGVNVNAIAPGYIATDNTQALRDDPVFVLTSLGWSLLVLTHMSC